MTALTRGRLAWRFSSVSARALVIYIRRCDRWSCFAAAFKHPHDRRRAPFRILFGSFSRSKVCWLSARLVPDLREFIDRPRQIENDLIDL